MYRFQKNTMSEILMVIQIRLFTVCTVISVTEARPLIYRNSIWAAQPKTCKEL